MSLSALAQAGEGEDAPPVPAPVPAPTEPAPDGEGEKEVNLANDLAALPQIDWWAVNQSFEEEKGAIVLSGSAWVRVRAMGRSIKLEADHIVFFQKTREIYAEGHIRLREGESEISAAVAYVDIPNDRGYLIDATVRVSSPSGDAPNPDGTISFVKKRDREEAFVDATEGKASLLRTKDPYGMYLDPVDDPQGRLNVVFRAEKLVRESRLHYYASDAFVTTDDMADPMYGVKIGQLDFFMKEVTDPDNPEKSDLVPHLIRGKSARVKVGPVTLFPFPTISYSLTQNLGFIGLDAGSSNRWGPYVLFRYGIGLGGSEDRLFDPRFLYFDLDNRLNRGPAGGVELKWNIGRRPKDAETRRELERGRGYVRVYGTPEIWIDEEDDVKRGILDRERRIQPKIDGFQRRRFDANILFNARRFKDDALPPDFKLVEYKDDTRGFVELGHHQPFRHAGPVNDVYLDLKFQQQSDRDFLLDYFSNDYLTGNQPEALASLRKPGDNYNLELLYRGNPQGFDGAPPRAAFDYGTFIVYEPALTYNLVPTHIGAGFYTSGEAQAGRLRREFEQLVIEQDDLEATRVYGQAVLQRPFRWKGLTFRPYAGGQLAFYDDSRDGGSTIQGAPVYGLDLTSRIYGTFEDARNADLAVNGFRHIIEPRIEYRAVGDTIEDPINVLDFDDVDDLQNLHRIRFSLDQDFQTRVEGGDGNFRSRNFAGFNMFIDVFPRADDRDRLLGGDISDLYRLNGYLHVVDAVRLEGELGVNLHDGDTELASYRVVIDPGGRWRLELSERFHFGDNERKIRGSDAFKIRFDFQLSERWAMSFSQLNQRKKGLLAEKGRDTTELTLSRRYGALVGSVSYRYDRIKRENGFGFSLRPAFAYRNLVLPADQLIVQQSSVDEQEALPEERNFDPYNLINKRRKKRKDQDVPGVPAPPPAEPVEPPPAPDAGDGGKNAPMQPADITPVQVKPAPKNLEQDDWATSASRE